MKLKAQSEIITEKIQIQSVIQAQMNQFYSAIAQEKENRVKVRNWQITILVSFIAYLTSKISVNITSSVFSFSLLASIIAIFWVIEGFYQSLVLAYLKRVGKLEKLLADQLEIQNGVPIKLFFESGFYTISSKEKYIFFIKACFMCKSIVFFNLALMIGVLVLVFFVLH